MGERIRSIDVAKGFIIIAIVIVHALFCQSVAGQTIPVTNPVILFGYLCLMMFFVISGFFYKPERSSAQNIWKRMRILVLAVVVCSVVLPLILMGYLVILGQPVEFNWYLDDLICIFGQKDMFQPYHGPAQHYWSIWICVGYYFIQTMIVAFVIFHLSARYVLADWKRLLLAVFILVSATALIRQFCIRPPLYLDLAPIACAFMFVGAATKKYDLLTKVEDGTLWKKGNWLLLVAALILLGVLMSVFVPSVAFQNTEFGDYGGWSAYPYFIEALCSCFIAIVAMSFIAKIPYVSDLLVIAGRHTLAILLLSMFLMKIIIAPIIPLSLEGTLPKMPVGFAICVGLLSLVLSIIIAVYGMKLIKYVRSRIAEKSD